MGLIKDTKQALIASGLHNSKMLHADNFTYTFTDYHTAVEDSVGTHRADRACTSLCRQHNVGVGSNYMYSTQPTRKCTISSNAQHFHGMLCAA
jgi:hypothetical protein